jgi:chemotaxis protein methyltransferase CheR
MTSPLPAAKPKAAPLAMTNEEYARFCNFFYRKTGIQFVDSKKYYVERRVADRIARTNSESFRDYFTLVRFQMSGQEMQFLVNAMTVNETYFFREDYQFDSLVKGILPEIAKSKSHGRPIRIWSMPCSSGEEPYSIAIKILELWGSSDAWDIEIHASDIDTKILDEARAGVYGERSLSRVPLATRQQYFVRRPDGNHQICAALRDSIDFSLVNIVDPIQTRRFRNFDVIFCRNLLIYFDDPGRREAAEMFFEALAPGGFLCLGHSESMSRISSIFAPRKFQESIVYQKPFSAE